MPASKQDSPQLGDFFRGQVEWLEGLLRGCDDSRTHRSWAYLTRVGKCQRTVLAFNLYLLHAYANAPAGKDVPDIMRPKLNSWSEATPEHDLTSLLELAERTRQLVKDWKVLLGRAEDIRKEVIRLKSTPLVTVLFREKRLGLQDLLHPLHADSAIEEKFTRFFYHVPDWAQELGPAFGKRRDSEDVLKHIVTHVKARTNRYHDTHVSRILKFLGLGPSSKNALVLWRRRHGIV